VAVTAVVGCTWTVGNTNFWITILSGTNNTNTIKTIREKLAPEAFEEFKAETPSMPAWMTATLRRYELEVADA